MNDNQMIKTKKIWYTLAIRTIKSFEYLEFK